MDASAIITALTVTPGASLALYGTAQHLRNLAVRSDGFATNAKVRKTLSEAAVRKSARQTRPLLTRPATKPATEFGRMLGRAVRPEGGRTLFARWEDVVAVLAPPRGGKTAYLGNVVIDAVGACLVTSTKLDIFTLTHLHRAWRGPVWLLNPENMGGGEHPSTFRWSPIPACRNPETAIATAAYMVAGGSTGGGIQDREFWENQNAKVLRSLLYAAAVGNKTMRDLARWVVSPNDMTALRLLENDPDTPAGWAEVLRQIMTTRAEKTRESVFLTLQLCLEFMADPNVARCALPVPGQPTFDVDAFVAGHGTLYLLGSAKQHGGMGPFFAALTGLIFEAAKRRSQAVPGERLDPPLSLVLDEATNICPVPLAQWASDSGGRGIALTYAIQSPSQLDERWGAANAKTIWQASNAKIILGGLTVQEDLDHFSRMLGERDDRTPMPFDPRSHHQAPQIRRIPVMGPAEIRELDDLHALLIYRNLKPVEIKIRAVWTRRDVRQAAKHPERFIPATPLAQVVPLRTEEK